MSVRFRPPAPLIYKGFRENGAPCFSSSESQFLILYYLYTTFADDMGVILVNPQMTKTGHCFTKYLQVQINYVYDDQR